MQRVKMPEQPPEERIKNFNEVPYGYTEDMAIKEASRCLQCKKPLCIEGCPVHVDIPGFIALIKKGKFIEASKKIKEENYLPAICGRVCPQERQCEKQCILGKKGEPIAIGNLERFVADYEREKGIIKPEIPKKLQRDKRIAVIGSGPAGLSAAGELAKRGYKVDVFEALHEFGGVLIYGIPEFRLPKKIVKEEISYLEALGVKFFKNYIIGKTETLESLRQRYDAVFIGTGAGLPSFLGIEGEELIGVYSANEYLTRINLMKAYDFPNSDTPVLVGKNVAVIGGGNVAMDCARTALRMKTEKVYLIYRRDIPQMPARKAEIEHAIEEGVEFVLLANPIRIIGNNEQRVIGIECIKMKLGEIDSSGRKKPIPIENSNFILKVDIVIVAIGNKPNPLIPSTTPELKIREDGAIIIDSKGRTSLNGVYAGGDIVSGAATVIEAMGAGKQAAITIDEDIRNDRI